MAWRGYPALWWLSTSAWGCSEAVQRAVASNLLITGCLAASRSAVLVGRSPSIAGRLAGRMAPVDRGDSLELELLWLVVKVRVG